VPPNFPAVTVPQTAIRLGFADLPEIFAVFADAFRDYPVMRFVLGSTASYESRLARLIELFVSGRAYRREPMFGVRTAGGALVAAATTSLPGSPEPPPEFIAVRETIWGELGAAERSRYESFTTATQRFAIPARHWHLNMIGVRGDHQGMGLSRPLLQAVHDASDRDAASVGVSLTTELPRNVGYYERFGYRIIGEARVGDSDSEFTTWTLFRDADQ
jgi:ribosomal protein S18 acetylase RimI-like enzyme